ncbi:porin family protein [Shewanella sp. OMA3-2]|uniref:porin family protein n=1 Tax=Shewanella sp. OMA3-2 TaxID=2908650 RepID=UPI001F24840C|nr:porin family protein [Shewanella sp. OMA3-2]UJF22196.1 porin family protein [Shewanella sp. OMA3-2]
MKKLSFITLPLLSLLSLPVMAENDHTGFYVGGAVNKVEFKVDDSEKETGLGIYGGYNFNHWFGLEANLFTSGNLGEDEFDVVAGAFTVTPKFTLQFNDTFSGYAKIGLASMALAIDTPDADTTFSGVGITYGVGLNASVTESLNIRLSYDVTSGDLESDDYGWINDLDSEIKQLALGLHYQF